MSLTKKQSDALISILRDRFEKNPGRHPRVEWSHVQSRLASNPGKLPSLQAMEATGGEPDVIGMESGTGQVIFCDCSAESPDGRRSLCFDREALDSRKEHKPAGNVVDTAAAMGIELLTEAQYRELQTLGCFDAKTSSWVETPTEIRRLGGTLFCDRRYGQVFVYHNGAQSYYASRGFRGLLKV